MRALFRLLSCNEGPFQLRAFLERNSLWPELVPSLFWSLPPAFSIFWCWCIGIRSLKPFTISCTDWPFQILMFLKSNFCYNLLFFFCFVIFPFSDQFIFHPDCFKLHTFLWYVFFGLSEFWITTLSASMWSLCVLCFLATQHTNWWEL